MKAFFVFVTPRAVLCYYRETHFGSPGRRLAARSQRLDSLVILALILYNKSGE
jgi:hypothetical protein